MSHNRRRKTRAGPARVRRPGRRRRTRRPRTRHGVGVQPPRGTGIAGQPQYDNTDLYAFVSPDKAGTVTLVGNWIPFEEPGGGPNFYPWATDARYDYQHRQRRRRHGRPHLPLDVQRHPHAHGRPTLHRQRHVPVQQRPGHLAHATTTCCSGRPTTSPWCGPVTPTSCCSTTHRSHRRSSVTPRCPTTVALRNAAMSKFTGGSVTSFAGQAEDPFFLDLRVFDLLYGEPAPATPRSATTRSTATTSTASRCRCRSRR